MPAIDVVSDANIALKWFLDADDEEETQSARQLLQLHRDRHVLLHVLDLTFYEVGNALLRGRARASADQTAAVTSALREICVIISPTADELAKACLLAAENELTLYDAAYAAVAIERQFRLVTLDRALLSAGLGVTPGGLVRDLP